MVDFYGDEQIMKPKNDIKSAPPYVRAYLDALRDFKAGKRYDEVIDRELHLLPGHPEITKDEFLSALAGAGEAWEDHQALTEKRDENIS